MHSQAAAALKAESSTNLSVFVALVSFTFAGQTPEVVPGEPGWNPSLASDSEAAVSHLLQGHCDAAAQAQCAVLQSGPSYLFETSCT
jgi:hypothetical protein